MPRSPNYSLKKPGTAHYEAEAIPGLEACAMDEIAERLDKRVSRLQVTRPGFLRFRYRGAPAALHELRSVIAIYALHRFDVPRPKALLGHQHFTRLTAILRATNAGWATAPASFGIGAAGSGSSVVQRLQRELAHELELASAAEGKGELHMRLARCKEASGWEALVRTTARPLSKREYRQVDVPGALNATVAYAMTRCGDLPRLARILNLCSGTSTIVIEHGLARSGDQLIALDCNLEMLESGRTNALAAGLGGRISVMRADARGTPLPASSFDRLYADLPFGHHVGTHTDNLELYPALLQEAARLAKPGADFIALTHELRLMRRCLAGSSWRIVEQRSINLRGLHPRLFVLIRN